MKIPSKKLVTFSVLFFLSGCGFNNPKNIAGSIQTGAPSPSNPTPTPAVTFTYLRQNIFIPKCSQCHGTNMGNYQYLMTNNYVVPSSADSSVLYQDVSTGDMPQNGPALSSGEVSSIYNWIQSGAKND